jgi:hypothetical protein
MTDNYEFNKSLESQTLNDSSPFADKQWLYLPDLNNGVYQNTSGNTLVQFNAQNIYNSQKFISPDMFFVIPVQMVYGIYGPKAAFAVGDNDFLDLTVNDYPWWSLLGMKNNNVNLIHQAEIIVEDHTLQQLMSHINISTHFQMLSRMSQDDLKHFGASIGMAEELDNSQSMKYNNNFNAPENKLKGLFTNNLGLEGNGLTNNRVFSEISLANHHQAILNKAQNYQCINLAKNKQLNRYTVINTINDGTSNNYIDSFNDIYGNGQGFLVSFDGLKKNYQPTVEYVTSKKLVVYTDYVIVKLRDLYNSIEQLPLCRRFNAKINLYLNTGVCSSKISLLATSATALQTTKPIYHFNGSNTTFANTMPYNHNYVPSFPLGTVSAYTLDKIYEWSLVSGLFVKQTQSFAVNGNAGLVADVSPFNSPNISISVPDAGLGTNLQSCRLYYSQTLLQPQEALKYVESNRNKRVVFRDVLLNQDNTIGAGASYSKLINSGIKNPLGVLIIPLIAKGQSDTTFHKYNFSQYQSPFDSCPSTLSPLSLINVNATLGGQNILQSVMDYNYENFLEQVANVDSITSSDYGISNGLFNQKYWQDAYKSYYIALDKCNPADKAIGRSLSVSYINNSNCAIDVLYFIFYMKEIEIDVQTGIINIV